MRPTLLETDDEDLLVMIRRCWSEEPGDRPDFGTIKGLIKRINKYILKIVVLPNSVAYNDVDERKSTKKMKLSLYN